MSTESGGIGDRHTWSFWRCKSRGGGRITGVWVDGWVSGAAPIAQVEVHFTVRRKGIFFQCGPIFITLLSSVRLFMWSWEYNDGMFQCSADLDLMWDSLHKVGASHGYILKAHMNKYTLPTITMTYYAILWFNSWVLEYWRLSLVL